MRKLKRADLEVAPVSTAGAAARKATSVPPTTKTCKTVQPYRVRRNQRRLDHLGAEAERWALAAIAAPLLQMAPGDRGEALRRLLALLKQHFKGLSVNRLERSMEAALEEGADEEQQTEALMSFLHLSAESDQFGCDLLGLVSPGPNEEPRPMLLEVKSDADRSFLVSAHEWETAKDIRESYAFLVALRGSDGDGAPRALELLVNPAQLAEDKALSMKEDGWRVGYRVNVDSGIPSPSAGGMRGRSPGPGQVSVPSPDGGKP